jgi:hypothetical protein
MALITVAEAIARSASELSSNAGTTAKLTTLIARADGMIATFCGYPRPASTSARTMESASYTIYSGSGWLEVDPSNHRRLLVAMSPLTVITSIHDDTAEEFGASSLVAPSDYSQRGDGGSVIYLSQSSAHGSWSRSPRLIKAVVTAGWADTTAPETLKQAAAELVMHLYELPKRRGTTNINQGNLVTTYRSETMPAHVAEMLGDYILSSSLV